MSNGILWPTIGLVLLTLIVFITMVAARGGHLRRTPPTPGSFATGAKAMEYFEPVELPANNYRNLFEMPVLYFALVPLLLVTGTATAAQVGLAWAYVLLRALHSFMHIVVRSIPRRALVYGASATVLFAMWIGFAVDLARMEAL